MLAAAGASRFSHQGCFLAPELNTPRAVSASCAFPSARRASNSSLDVVTLGNLCLDIVLNVPRLPPANVDARLSYMRSLEASPPQENAWEAGGICNFTIAAARLGLDCVSAGHVGNEGYGLFLSKVLEAEGVSLLPILEQDASVVSDHYDGSTLVCWVLVDPDHNHEFCSRFDFNKTPVLGSLVTLPGKAEDVIRRSKALFLNGFAFDELLPSVIFSALDCAHSSGNAVFFDPGPRGESLFKQDQGTLEQLLNRSDVLLLTSEEATTITGIKDPEASAKALLNQGKQAKWVIVKLGAEGSLMANDEGLYHSPAFEVEVVDTVGCGDSFAAAAVVGYNRGLAPKTTLALANAVGAATAMGCGAGRNVASLANVHKVLSSRSDGASEAALAIVTSSIAREVFSR